MNAVQLGVDATARPALAGHRGARVRPVIAGCQGRTAREGRSGPHVPDDGIAAFVQIDAGLQCAVCEIAPTGGDLRPIHEPIRG